MWIAKARYKLFSRKLVHVRRQCNRIVGQKIEVYEPKTRYSRRDVPIPEVMENIL